MAIQPINIAVLASGGGTTLQNLIDEIGKGHLNARINLVVASRPNIGVISRAAAAGLDNTVVDCRSFGSFAEFSRPVFKLCEEAQVDLICLAGWLSMLAIPVPYQNRVINIHPSLLPSFGGRGMYGQHVHGAVLEHGCKVSGCTVHFVNDDYDSGPIILQRTCPVLEEDTPETLAHRVFEEEKIAYPQAIRLFQERRLRIEGRRVKIDPEAR
jgi:phosphoribosylglycinamide formyltransferase 1